MTEPTEGEEMHYTLHPHAQWLLFIAFMLAVGLTVGVAGFAISHALSR